MKKFLLLLTLFLSGFIIPAVAVTGQSEISCDLDAVAQRGIYSASGYTNTNFIIDDVDKKLYICEAGNRRFLMGNTNIFDSSEISIDNINYGKNKKAKVYINRRSGAIKFETIESNIWWGDTITKYQGYCRKAQEQLF